MAIPHDSRELPAVFERARAIRTLLTLLSSADDGLDQLLVRIGGSKRTSMQRIHEFVRLGLVVKTVHPEVARKVIYRLTPDGKRIAEALKHAAEALEDGAGKRN